MAKITVALLIVAAFTLPKEQILASKVSSKETVDKLLDNFGDRRELIARLLRPLQAAAKSEDDHEKIGNFAKKLHTDHPDWESQLFGDKYSMLDAFTTFKKISRGKEAVIRAAIRPLLSRLPDGDKLTEEFMTALEEPIQHGGCQLCRTFITILKLASYIMDWSSLHDVLRLTCWVVLPLIEPTWTRVDVICPSVLDLQGQHIYNILRGDYADGILPIKPGPLEVKLPPFPQEVCEFLNACFPPEEEPAHVRKQLENKRAPPMGSRDKRSTGTIKVAQITDIHLEPRYDEGSLTDCGLPVCCQLIHGTGDAGPWGDYQCNTPEKTVDHMLGWIQEQNADVVIYSGDNCPHSVWQETVDSQLQASYMVIASFNKSMPGKQVFPNIGNHEMYPTNVYSKAHLPVTQQINDQLTDWWKPVAKFDEAQVETMRDQSYYTQLARPGLRILSYNTNLMYIYNWYNIHNDQQPTLPPRIGDITRMKNFMETTLQDAAANGEKVIIVGHHPPGRSDFILSDSRWLTNLLLQYSDIIVLHMSGHTHKDEFKLVTDPSSGNPKSVVFVAPTMSSVGHNNPTIRFYHLDNTTFELVDYDSYFLDIADVGNNPSPALKLGYSAKSEYGLADLSPASLKDFADRMAKDTVLFSKYMHNYYTRARPGYICNNYCKEQQLCQMRHSNYDQLYDCLQALKPATTVQPTTTPLACPTPPIIKPCVCPTTVPLPEQVNPSGSDRLRMTALTLLCSCFVGAIQLMYRI